MNNKEKALYQVFRYIAKELLIRTLEDLESDFNCLWLYDIFPQAEINNIKCFIRASTYVEYNH